MYNAVFRLHFEYHVQICSTFLNKDETYSKQFQRLGKVMREVQVGKNYQMKLKSVDGFHQSSAQ